MRRQRWFILLIISCPSNQYIIASLGELCSKRRLGGAGPRGSAKPVDGEWEVLSENLPADVREGPCPIRSATDAPSVGRRRSQARLRRCRFVTLSPCLAFLVRPSGRLLAQGDRSNTHHRAFARGVAVLARATQRPEAAPPNRRTGEWRCAGARKSPVLPHADAGCSVRLKERGPDGISRVAARPGRVDRPAAVGHAHGADRRAAHVRAAAARHAGPGAQDAAPGVLGRLGRDRHPAKQHRHGLDGRGLRGGRPRRPRSGAGRDARRQRRHHADRAGAFF